MVCGDEAAKEEIIPFLYPLLKIWIDFTLLQPHYP